VPVSFRNARARRRRLRDEGLPSPHYPDRRSPPPSRKSPPPRPGRHAHRGAHPSKAHRACGSKFPRSFDDSDAESYSSPSEGGVSSPAGSGRGSNGSGGASDDWGRRAAGYHQAGPNSASRRWAAGQLGTLDGYEPDGADGNCSGSGPETPTSRSRTTPGAFQEREGGRAPPVTRPPGKTMRRNGSGGSVGSAPGRRPPPRSNSRAARAAAYDGSESST